VKQLSTIRLYRPPAVTVAELDEWKYSHSY